MKYGNLFKLVFGLALLPAAGQIRPPFVVPFDGAGLPDLPWITYESTATGRMRIQPGTLTVHPEEGPFQSANGTSRIRGNIYEVTSARILGAQDFYLERPVAMDVDFLVYRAASVSGPYSLISQRTRRVPAGAGYISSGSMGLELTPNAFYMIGVAWGDESATFEWRSGTPLPASTSFGQIRGGYLNNSAPPPPPATLAGVSPNANAYRQKLRTSVLPSTEEIPTPGSNLTGTLTNAFRGNIYEITEDIQLVRLGVYLNFSEDTPITTTIHESDTRDGTYTRIFQKTTTWGAINSPWITLTNELDFQGVELRAGRFYLIGIRWEGSRVYQYRLNAFSTPQTLPFGVALEGKQFSGHPPETFENSGTPSLTAYPQQLMTLASGSLRMDSSLINSLSINRADMNVDLSQFTNATLRFTHRSRGSSTYEEGVYLSPDGDTWHKILDLPDGTSPQEEFEVDLVQAAQNHSLPLTHNMYIRLQQQNDQPWPLFNNGREFRRVRIDTPPDLRLALVNTQPQFFRGANIPKEIAFQALYEVRGGSEDLPDTFHTARFSIQVGDTAYTQDQIKLLIGVNAYSAKAESILETVTVPAEVLMPDFLYEVGINLDATSNLFPQASATNHILSSASFAINHYSGTLFFGNAPAEIWIESMTIRDMNEINTAHNISGHGIIQGRVFTFTDLQVEKDLATLDYTVIAGETQILEVGGIEPSSINGTHYSSIGPVRLTASGPRADIRATFPAGFGRLQIGSAHIALPTIDFENNLLNGDLGLPNTLVNAGTFWCVTETLPLLFEVSGIVWVPSFSVFGSPEISRFALGATGNTVYVRANHLNALDFAYTSEWITEEMAVRKNNAGYHRFVSANAGAMGLSPGPDGEARLDASFTIAPGELVTHTPMNVEIVWGNAGMLVLDQGLPAPGSTLEGITALMVDFARGCPDNCEDADTLETLVLIPGDSSLAITRDGGLHGAVTLPGAPVVQWGRLPTGNLHAMRIDSVDNGRFVASGHVLPGADAAGLAVEHRPGAALLSGIGWDNPYTAERPGTAAYSEGAGGYAGLNFRIPDQISPSARSVVGGAEFGPFNLQSASKFYVRSSGVSGVFNAGSTNMSGPIYGYPFTFDSFAFSYLSNINRASRTDGNLTLPHPVNAQIDFERMTLSCKGELDEANPAPGANEILLAYWNADFRFSQIAFLREEGCEVPPGTGSLVLRGRSQAAHIPEPLFAALGFHPDGNIIRPADNIAGITSRFSLPADFMVAGSDGEDFRFTAASEPYLNHYAADTGFGPGFFSLAGVLSVPFFGEIPVHTQTLAGDDISLPLYMANGRPTGGWSGVAGGNFFDSVEFDAGNIGWPAGNIDLVSYRTGGNAEFRPRVNREWVGGVEFDFDVRWSPGTRAMRSPDFVNKNILVLPIDHEIKYLSAKRAEISFGVAYDGLPSLSLGSLAFDALDRMGFEIPGPATAVLSAGLRPLTDAIEAGFDSLDRVLSPASADLLAPVYTHLIDPVVEELYDQLIEIEWDDGGIQLGMALDRVIRGQANGGPVPLWNGSAVFQFFFDGFEGNPGLLDQLVDEVDRAVRALDAVNVGNQINFNPDDAAELTNGLLHRATDGRYEHLEILTLTFFELYFQTLGGSHTVPPEIVSTVRSMIDKSVPGLMALSELLSGVREELTALQESLQVGGSFRAELNAVIDLPEIQLMLGRISVNIEERLLAWHGGRLAITDLTEEEFKALLRRELIAEFEGSPILGDLTASLRARLFTPEISFRIATDGLFQIVNGFVRELVASSFAAIDDVIGGFLGNLEEMIGAGSIDGYAHIRGDSLERLSLDAAFRMNITSPLEFSGGLLIETLQAPPLQINETLSVRGPRISIGAQEVPLDWLGGDVSASIATRIGLSANSRPVNLGGSFSFEDDIGVEFEGMTLKRLTAAFAFGANENYLGGAGRAEFDEFEVAAGFFIGTSQSLEPLEVIDSEVATVVGQAPFSGAYIYGEAWVPVLSYGCALRIGASMGAGFFYFIEGPSYGMKLSMGASGEALCLFTIRGQVSMTGGRSHGQYRAAGTGRLSGTVGPCDLCKRWSKSVHFRYTDGSWSADY